MLRIEEFATTTLVASGSETLSKTLLNLIQRRVSRCKAKCADPPAPRRNRRSPADHLWRNAFPTCATHTPRTSRSRIAPDRYRPHRARQAIDHHRVWQFPEDQAGRVSPQSLERRGRAGGAERQEGDTHGEQARRVGQSPGASAEGSKVKGDGDEVFHPNGCGEFCGAVHLFQSPSRRHVAVAGMACPIQAPCTGYEARQSLTSRRSSRA